MMKKKFFLLLFLLIISFYKSNNLSDIYLLPPSNIKVTNITPTSATVSWDPVFGTGYVVSYNIVGNPGSGGTNYTSNSSITITGLTQCKNYEVTVSNAQAGAGPSAAVFFTTSMLYCMDNSITPATPNIYISNVTVNATGLPVMVSNSTATSYFTNYRTDPMRKVKLAIGNTNNTISITKAGSYINTPTTLKVWIDYNGDRSFDSSSGELIFNSINDTNPTITTTFDIPSQVFLGPCKVIMRVISSTSQYIGSCGAPGEIEDYEVEFVDPSSLTVEENEKNNEIIVYPNPCSDVLNILGVSSDTEFEIYNIAGQKISKGQILDYKVNVHNLIKGTYFIQINDKKNTTRLKFIKN